MAMKLNWDAWVYGLGAAVIGGGASAVAAGFAQAITDPEHAGVHHLFVLMGVTFVIAGAISAAAYLAKSPLPPPLQGAVVVNPPANATETTTTVVSKTEAPKL